MMREKEALTESTIPEFKLFNCPRCKKRRLIRPLNHIVNCEEQELTLESGRKVKHFIDVCVACQNVILKDIYTPSDKLKDVLKAMHDPANADLQGKSLEELL